MVSGFLWYLNKEESGITHRRLHIWINRSLSKQMQIRFYFIIVSMIICMVPKIFTLALGFISIP